MLAAVEPTTLAASGRSAGWSVKRRVDRTAWRRVADESRRSPRERHFEVVPLALPGEQRSKPFTTEVEDAEGCWISLANVLDDHEVEALRVGFSCLDLPDLKP